jgi:hypothetical protein
MICFLCIKPQSTHSLPVSSGSNTRSEKCKDLELFASFVTAISANLMVAKGTPSTDSVLHIINETNDMAFGVKS